MRRATLAITALLAGFAPARAQSALVKIAAPDEVRSTAFSPNGDKIAAALEKNRVAVWSLPAGKLLRTIDLEKEQAARLLFATRGKHLLIVLRSGTIQARDVESGALLRSFKAAIRQTELGVSRDSRLLGTGGEDGQINLWDYDTGKLLRRFAPEFGGTSDLAFSPDGSVLASSGEDANLYLWDTATGQLKTAVRDLLLATFALTFTSDGKTLLAGGADRAIHFVDVSSGRITRSYPPEKHPVATLMLSPDGGSLAAALRDADDPSRPAPLVVWDLRSGQILKRIDFSAPPSGGGYAVDGRLLYSIAKGRELAVWSLP